MVLLEQIHLSGQTCNKSIQKVFLPDLNTFDYRYFLNLKATKNPPIISQEELSKLPFKKFGIFLGKKFFVNFFQKKKIRNLYFEMCFSWKYGSVNFRKRERLS